VVAGALRKAAGGVIRKPKPASVDGSSTATKLSSAASAAVSNSQTVDTPSPAQMAEDIAAVANAAAAAAAAAVSKDASPAAASRVVFAAAKTGHINIALLDGGLYDAKGVWVTVPPPLPAAPAAKSTPKVATSGGNAKHLRGSGYQNADEGQDAGSTSSVDANPLATKRMRTPATAAAGRVGAPAAAGAGASSSSSAAPTELHMKHTMRVVIVPAKFEQESFELYKQYQVSLV
jgi:hypothetical protein